MDAAAINVPIYIESRYRVNRKRIKERVIDALKIKGIKSACEVSIAIVGDRKMRALNKKYRNIDKTTNVLSFPQAEGDKMPNPTGKIFLGDIIISYPVVINEASLYNKLVDDWTCELVEHGLQHLLGIHHK